MDFTRRSLLAAIAALPAVARLGAKTSPATPPSAAVQPAAPTLGYWPTPTQSCFHDTRALYKGLCGRRGSGKTTALAYEAVRLATVNPGLVGVVAAPGWSMLETDLAGLALCAGPLCGTGLPSSSGWQTFFPRFSKIQILPAIPQH